MFSEFGPFVIDVHCEPIGDVNDQHSTNQVSEFPWPLIRKTRPQLCAEEREFVTGYVCLNIAHKHSLVSVIVFILVYDS